MSEDKKDKDLSLLELFSRAVEKGAESGEPGQLGRVHILVMPDKIVKAVREKIEVTDKDLANLNYYIEHRIPGDIRKREDHIKDSEKNIDKYTRNPDDCSRDYCNGQITCSRETIERLKGENRRDEQESERLKKERDRLQDLRSRYEEMVLKKLEASLKG